MLEGLEISEIRLSAVREHNEKLRIDSGYFAKPMLQAEILARSYRQGHSDLGALFSRFAKGIFDINAGAYTGSGVPFVRIGDLRAGMIDERGLVFIPEEIHATEAKTELLRGDVVLSKTAYPAAALVTFARGNTSQDTIATRLSSDAAQSWQPEAIVAYLCSTLGQRLMWRQFQGNVQLHLSLDDARKVPIPRFGQALQAGIAKVYATAEQALRSAEARSADAERRLLAELQLADWNPPRPLHYVCRSGEAFGAERLDAEHFQPGYAELVERLRATGQAASLGSLLLSNERGSQPDYAEEGLPVVNSKHVGRGSVTIDAGNRFASSAPLLIEPGDVLLNGTGVGTIGRAAAYLHEGKAVPDNHVTVLRPKLDQLDPVFLAVQLNTLVGRMQVQQWQRGSSGQLELYPADIAQFTVWVAPPDVQREVRKAVEGGFAAKQRAQALLAAAQRAVEIAIEESEESALQHLRMVVPKRPLAPLMDRVRVEPLPDIPVDLRKHTGLVIPDSARSKDDGLSCIAPLSPQDVLAVIEGTGPLAAPQAGPDPQAQLLSDPRNVPLWFGTNREPVDRGAIGQGFSGRRSADGSVRHGRCIVNVPAGHALGSTGTHGLKGWWQRWRHGVDDRLRLLRTEGLDAPAFWQAVRAAMDEADAQQRVPEALLFVHGYRVSFEDAALRAAQLAYDLKIRDTSFFAWPSAGAAAQYTVDEASAKNATRPLAEFIAALDACAQASGKALHIVAHSMGNRVLLAALQWLVSHGRAPVAVDKIVCAAPDEDAADFVAAMAELRQVGRRRTLYASSKDKPVWLSEVVHGYARAGRIPPVTLAEGLDTVDASELEATFLGHSDFATERPLLQDLFGLLKASLAPRERLGLEAVTSDAGAYWRLK